MRVQVVVTGKWHQHHREGVQLFSHTCPHSPAHCAQAMRDIVAKCLMKDPSRRPTAAQLLEHKFFKVRCHGL